MQSSRNYSEELQRCTELTDKLFTEVREKGLELKQKNETIGYLEKHLNESVDEIERLNELLRSSIDSDNKAFQ
jgi:predicted RNase H-like nuclease (RuvC/YqgF family)